MSHCCTSNSLVCAGAIDNMLRSRLQVRRGWPEAPTKEIKMKTQLCLRSSFLVRMWTKYKSSGSSSICQHHEDMHRDK
eukprot:2502513-Amphidinium_carterae.1